MGSVGSLVLAISHFPGIRRLIRFGNSHKLHHSFPKSTSRTAVEGEKSRRSKQTQSSGSDECRIHWQVRHPRISQTDCQYLSDSDYFDLDYSEFITRLETAESQGSGFISSGLRVAGSPKFSLVIVWNWIDTERHTIVREYICEHACTREHGPQKRTH